MARRLSLLFLVFEGTRGDKNRKISDDGAPSPRAARVLCERDFRGPRRALHYSACERAVFCLDPALASIPPGVAAKGWLTIAWHRIEN